PIISKKMTLSKDFFVRKEDRGPSLQARLLRRRCRRRPSDVPFCGPDAGRIFHTGEVLHAGRKARLPNSVHRFSKYRPADLPLPPAYKIRSSPAGVRTRHAPAVRPATRHTARMSDVRNYAAAERSHLPELFHLLSRKIRRTSFQYIRIFRRSFQLYRYTRQISSPKRKPVRTIYQEYGLSVRFR